MVDLQNTIASQALPLLTANIPGNQIAEQLGCSKQYISKIKSKPEIKALVEQCQAEAIAKTAKAATDNLIHLITNYKSNKCETEKDRIEKSHGYKATERMAENIGILPAHTQSVYIQQIFGESKTVIDADVLNIIDRYAGDNTQIEVNPDVIDLLPVDE